MDLKEKYDIDGKPYHYLITNDAKEAAIFVKLAELYPSYFAIQVEKWHYNPYELQLRILKNS